MEKGKRPTYPGAIHHIICRGNDKHPMFHEDGDRHHYLSLLKTHSQKSEIRILAFSLMENHVHLLIEVGNYNLSKFMHSFNTAYVNWYNKKWGRSGHVFEGKFKSPIVETDTYLLEVSRYIHLNAFAAGLVSDPAEYPWSSYKAYTGEGGEFSFVSTDRILSLFGDNLQQARELYKKFVNDGLEKINEEFKMKEEWYKISKISKKRDEVGLSNVEEKIKTIIDKVVKIYNLDLMEVMTARNLNCTQARQIIMLLAREIYKLKLNEIGEFFGIPRQNVDYSIKKVKREMEKSKILVEEVEKIRRRIEFNCKV